VILVIFTRRLLLAEFGQDSELLVVENRFEANELNVVNLIVRAIL